MEIVKDDEWGLYPHFTRDEMKCKHTGLCLMTHKMMKTLEDIRAEYKLPMVISSAYRDISHPVERAKQEPGEHTLGLAVDVVIYGMNAINLINIATNLGVKRFGLAQKGSTSTRFIHLGIGDQDNGRFPRGLWTY